MQDLGQDVWDARAIEGTVNDTPSLSSTCSSPVESHECLPITPSAIPMADRSFTVPSQMDLPFEACKADAKRYLTRSASVSSLYTAAAQSSHPPETVAPVPAQDSPSVDFLIYVAEAHRPLFLSYVALQESCKELAAFLTVFYSIDRAE